MERIETTRIPVIDDNGKRQTVERRRVFFDTGTHLEPNDESFHDWYFTSDGLEVKFINEPDNQRFEVFNTGEILRKL